MDPFSLDIPGFPLILGQLLRGACIAVAPFCMILAFLLIRRTNMARYRKRVYAGLIGLLASAVYTQAERWNDPVTPRLFIAVISILLVFSGLWRMRDYQTREV